MRYHSAAVGVVSLGDEIGELARRFLRGVPQLAKRDKQLLQDVARGRYTFATLEALIAIARRATDPALRELLAECIRGRLVAEEAPRAVEVQIALDLETAAQGPADIAAREYERHPSSTTRARAIECHTMHWRRLRAVLDSLHISRC